MIFNHCEKNWKLNASIKSDVHVWVLSSFSRVWFFVTPWTVACQAPLSMGILQARILEWVVVSSSRGSSGPRDWTHISYVSWNWQVSSLLLAPSTLSHVQRAIESAVIKTKLYWVKPYAIVFVVQNWLNFGNSYGSAKQKNVFLICK